MTLDFSKTNPTSLKSFDGAKKVHFIGIGGIGVSAIARMMLHEGKTVSGSDMSDSDVIAELKKAGAEIQIGQNIDMVPKDADLIVYTIAIQKYDPKLLEVVKKFPATMLSYPETLGILSKDKYTIAVSGTHGKTTTTAMIAKILMDAGLDPTVVVGSLMRPAVSVRTGVPVFEKRGEIESPLFENRDGGSAPTNFIAGKSKYLVIEACEYERSFLNYYPQILVITNIDNDHLDYYKDLADIQSAFKEIAERVPQDGFLITDKNNSAVVPVLKNVEGKIVNYTLYSDLPIQLKVPGIHNKKNAAASFSVAIALGIDPKVAQQSLEGFAGTWRRFEYKGETEKGVKVYDDYGHHPTEIKATLQGLRELYPRERVIVVFQPHLFSRTKLLLDDFAGAFEAADEIILAPIYAAREIDDKTISSEHLKDEIVKHGQHAVTYPNFSEIQNYLIHDSKKGDVIITMGAGDIHRVGEAIAR